MTEPFDVTARMCAEFAAHLRRHGVPVGPEQTVVLYTGLHLLGRIRIRDLYWAGRAVVAGGRDQFPAYDAAFREYFLGDSGSDDVAVAFPRPTAVTEVASEVPSAGTPSAQPAESPEEQVDEARLTPSDVRLLKSKSFEHMDAAEQRHAAALVRTLDAELPRRRSRRRVPSTRGRHLDNRGSLRAALRTDGEPIRLARRRNPMRERTLTLVVDISGSMAPYAQAMLRFAHTMLHAGHRIEVFTIGVGLTRITDALRRPSVDAALRRVATAVRDWDGGTRLGTSFATLAERFGGHRAVRGAVVVVCSDGLDRDEPATLESAMRAVHRLAYRTIWLNPLKGDPRYRPLQRAMMAALPHIDVFLPGHNVVGLEELCTAVAAGHPRASDRRQA